MHDKSEDRSATKAPQWFEVAEIQQQRQRSDRRERRGDVNRHWHKRCVSSEQGIAPAR
jgi:hypothetical protein